MKFLLRHIRVVIYILSFLLAASLYIIAKSEFSSIKITQWYGFASFIALYFTLLASPLHAIFPTIPFKSLYMKARKALGISSFFFGMLHGYIGFFGLMGGMQGLFVWSNYYIWSIIFGLIALLILGILALTSIDFVKRRLGKWWKYIHRSIYIAAFLILVHAAMVTVHILNLTPVLIVTYIALVFLVGLEIVRFDKYISSKYSHIPQRVTASFGLPAASILLFWAFFFLNHHLH